MSTAAPPVSVPHWTDSLWYGLVVYIAACTVCLVTGLGGPTVHHYVGLLCDAPANLVSAVFAAAAARRLTQGPQRTAWRWLSAALFVYFIGSIISMSSWLLWNVDPVPGPADAFFVTFYPVLFAATLYFIRAAALRIRWAYLALDAAIYSVGFSAFFWYLVIRPSASTTEAGFLKQALSQTFIAGDCLLLLMFGVLLLTGARDSMARRVPLLLLSGFATMFLGDIVWSLAKARGFYLSGDPQDILYLLCYAPIAAAGRTQLRTRDRLPQPDSTGSDTLVQSLPYAAMLAAFLLLVYIARGDIGGPATVMTMVVFVLTLLLMGRQAMVLREDASLRERNAVRVVEDRYASLIANATDVIMIVAVDGTLRFASPVAERTLGLKSDELEGRNLIDLWAGSDSEQLRAFLTEIQSAPTGAAVGPVELRIHRGDARYTLEIVGSNLLQDPAVHGLALNLRDTSERKALEEQLRQRAFHDPLTMLANRNLFRDRVQHALTLANRDRPSVAVMFLDLDNFKNINDSLGHEVGDRLLQAASQRLVQATRSSDTVSRLGGDEFAILLEGITLPTEVERVATSLIDTLSQPFSLNATEVRVSASIGVAYSTPDVDVEALLSNADIAMYHAKAAGKNRHVIFQLQMQELLHERLRLEADMARGLENREFFVEYQPIVDLGTRALLGVEALVRWRHPEFGLLMPGRFIPIAEECGFISKLGHWVLVQACREMREWRESVAGGASLRVAVNTSGRHLQHGNLVQDVALALQQSGLEPDNLVIELTESTMMYNTDTNLARLRQLKLLGVRLAIDDFGTGYSSLSYLHRFPIDILKIDRSFVSRLADTDDGPELARAVVMLGETLGLDTIAEGIELEPQVAALLDLGCVAGQGFLFEKAVTLAQLSKSSFVERRTAYWTAQAAREVFSATGRFAALKVAGKRTLGAA